MLAGAVEVVAATDRDAPLVLTCEHASRRLPPPWRWNEADRWLARTHWAWDIGAARLTRELAAAAGAEAVLARFTRLLADPNRAPGEPSLVRTHAEGRAIALNAAVDEADERRRMRYWEAYHHAVDQSARRTSAPFLLAVHSFTPEYEGARRAVEIGVLFDREEDLGKELHAALAPLGDVRLNEPYSGRGGLMYSAQRHADAHGKRALEIEVRQDRILSASFRRAICAAILSLLARARRAATG